MLSPLYIGTLPEPPRSAYKKRKALRDGFDHLVFARGLAEARRRKLLCLRCNEALCDT